jgi:hypothetical protein
MPLNIEAGIGEPEDEGSPASLLRTCRNRPCEGCPAEQRDELAATAHSITSSARASSVGGLRGLEVDLNSL